MKHLFGLIALCLVVCVLGSCNSEQKEPMPFLEICKPCIINQDQVLIIESSPSAIHLDVNGTVRVLQYFPVYFTLIAGDTIRFKADRMAQYEFKPIDNPHQSDRQPASYQKKPEPLNL